MSSVPTIPARFQDPSDDRPPAKIISRWELFLGAIATGAAIEKAMIDQCIKRREIQAMIDSSPLERQRYRDAVLAGLRSAYSEFDLEEFFDRVAMGKLVADAYREVFGREITATFYRIIRDDPDMAERYKSSLKTKADLEMEKTLDIIDDDTKDTLPGPKGGEIPNMAAVQRSRLRFEGRHKMAAAWHRNLYGEEKKSVDVNVSIDLAARIEEGRIRAKERKVVLSPKEMRDAIDAKFEETVEDKPMDTTWLEEK